MMVLDASCLQPFEIVTLVFGCCSAVGHGCYRNREGDVVVIFGKFQCEEAFENL